MARWRDEKDEPPRRFVKKKFIPAEFSKPDKKRTSRKKPNFKHNRRAE